MKITHEGIEIEVYQKPNFLTQPCFHWYIESEDAMSPIPFTTEDIAIADAKKWVNDYLQSQEDNYTNQLIS